MTAVLALGVGAFAAASALTMVARMYALRRQLFDAPGARRSHRVVTPRGGGIAIVAVVLPVMVWLGLVATGSPVLLAGACGLALVAAVGWIDDHRPLSPWARLAVHVVAAGLLAWALVASGAPLWWAASVFLLTLGLVNTWNFLDGIDGIAVTQAIIFAVGILLIGRGMAALLAFAYAAACAGFLPWNFPKARIFLGDVGSGALGYVAACLVALTPEPRPADLLIVLLPLSGVLIDTTLTLFSRIIAGEPFWMPHVQHAYQRCVQAGYTHARVTGGFAAWTLLSLVVAVGTSGASQPVIIGAFATWYAVGTAIWFVLRARLRRASVVGMRLHD
ncbi:lipopolysaccharide biosynthesis protein [Luteimonas sp. 100069]|uniref:lipopolysaccharide biosynthesis protein n=1 Tax=Luteimonas sp. 100069 TaxID=2006109 RepID=UPI0013152C83|nr:lipopolysaccharide biosynthesis protein [Luteimonas sp. 100069]